MCLRAKDLGRLGHVTPIVLLVLCLFYRRARNYIQQTCRTMKHGFGCCTLLYGKPNAVVLQRDVGVASRHFEAIQPAKFTQLWPPLSIQHGIAQSAHLRQHTFAATPEDFGEPINDLDPVLNHKKSKQIQKRSFPV